MNASPSTNGVATPHSFRTRFAGGAWACLPVALSVIPFATVMSVAAAEAGFSAWETAGMSVTIFAGASQLVTIELTRQGAPALIIVATALLVNLRFMMYSAALAPHVRGLPRLQRGPLAYLLTDQAFAISLPVFDEGADLRERAGFFAGAGVMLWLTWQVGTWIGIGLGNALPSDWSLDFTVALAFIALAAPLLRTRPTVAAASASVIAYMLSSSLPYGLALLPAAAAGITAGVWVEGRAS